MAPAAFCPACGGALDEARPHPVCTRCGRTRYRDPKVGVGVAVLDDEGRLLLVRRAGEPGRGRWALPAGFVDADEDPRRAAEREAREEAGVEVRCGAVLDVYDGGGGASFFLAFAAELVAGTPVAGDDALEAAFFGPEELPPLAFASTLDAVARLRAGTLSTARPSAPRADGTPRG